MDKQEFLKELRRADGVIGYPCPSEITKSCDHPYTTYRCDFTGRSVCYQCDPFGDNWSHHTPASAEEMKKIRRRIEDRLRKDPKFFRAVASLNLDI